MSQISATLSATQALHPRQTLKADLDESLPKSGVALDPDKVFAELVMHHQDRAIRLALRLLSGDRAAAEDVVQEAYLRAHRGLSRFRGDARLTTWFDRIVVREAYRHHRRPWRRWLAGEEPQDHVQPERPSPPDPLLQDRIHASLERLTMHQRTVFVLMHLEVGSGQCKAVT